MSEFTKVLLSGIIIAAMTIGGFIWVDLTQRENAVKYETKKRE